MELELKHLDVYPKGINGLCLWDTDDLCIVNICSIHYTEKTIKTNGFWSKPKDYKLLEPYLRPLSDLTKEIEHNGEKFVPIEYFSENYTDHLVRFEKPDYIILEDDYSLSQNVLGAPLAIIEKLFEWYFDIFGLIENGLAIDINTLNK